MGLAVVTLTATLTGPGGQPLPGGCLLTVGAQCIMRPNTPQEAARDALLRAQGASPVNLTFTPLPPGNAAGRFVWRKTCTAADGTLTLDMPTPAALCYANGARTDADLDPQRGGRYSVRYYLLLGDAPPRHFTVTETAISGGKLDITTALCADPNA